MSVFILLMKDDDRALARDWLDLTSFIEKREVTFTPVLHPKS